MAGNGCARIAAVGDVHLGAESAGSLRPVLSCLPEQADMLLLAGDLTRHGTLDEARVVATEFADLGVPVIAVLGNHDYHSDAEDEITALLTDHGIVVLEGTATTVRLPDGIVTVAGTKGFGGGFAGKCASAFGERIMRDFAGYTAHLAASLQAALSGPRADLTVALTHYSPVGDTLHGEPPEIHPFLGSYLLGEAVDAGRADLAIHGHAHAGCEQGTTPGGVRVRNVAQPVIRTAFAVYELPIRIAEPAVAD